MISSDELENFLEYFRVSVNLHSKNLFEYFSEDLIPQNVIIAVPTDENEMEDRRLVVVSDQDGDQNIDLEDVLGKIENLKALDREAKMIHSHPLAQRQHEVQMDRKALRAAIKRVVEESVWHKSQSLFCSWAGHFRGYLVSVVLIFDTENFSNFYQLPKTHYALTEVRNIEIPRSLIHASIVEFLKACRQSIRLGDYSLGLDTFETLRLAGSELTNSIELQLLDGNEIGHRRTYDYLNRIAASKYEGDEGSGRIIFANPDHPNIDIDIKLKNPVSLSKFRAVRKLLEISTETYSLLCNGGDIYGIGSTVGTYNAQLQNLFQVRFIGFFKWQLEHADHVLMRADYAQPDIPRSILNFDDFRAKIIRVFSNTESSQINHLWELTQRAIEQKHGTMLVISHDAHEESKRLQNQSTLIESVRMSPELMDIITAIDGAVIMDLNSNCYAIGVILDGQATEKGTSARGARYNSAIRYVEQQKTENTYNCLAVIISEDRTVDIVPSLPPKIKKSSLKEKIDVLRKMKREQKFDRKKFFETIDWLLDHKFYLSTEQCETINELQREIQNFGESTVVLERPFRSNPEMNDSYFLNDGDE